MILTLGRDGRRQSIKELAFTFGKSADTATYLTREGIRLRLEDEAFARRFEALNATMIERNQSTTGST